MPVNIRSQTEYINGPLMKYVVMAYRIKWQLNLFRCLIDEHYPKISKIVVSEKSIRKRTIPIPLATDVLFFLSTKELLSVYSKILTDMEDQCV